MGVILSAENVSIRYITGDFKDIGLKEYTVRKLTNNYHVNEFMAVENVSFQLERGDMLGIIGANGAGKSTLLKAVAGIMEPSQGKIAANGEIAALLELGSGFDGDLTVRENAYLRGAMLGYTREFMDDTYKQIIEFAELEGFDDRPFKQLSSGMKSRLAFSIASLVKPDILILDEVLSVGDGAFQKKSAEKMREIIDQGAATILVSHSLNQIRELCNKVLWLDHGRQVAFGETQEICDQYERFLQGEFSAEMLGANEEQEAEKQETEISATTVISKLPRQISRKSVLVSLALALFFAIFVFNLGAKYFEKTQVSQVAITAQGGSGKVIFRGAFVDGNWISPAENVSEGGGWQYDGGQDIYTAVDSQPLELLLPAGKGRELIFYAGPDAGVVSINLDGEHFKFDLRYDIAEELGLAYQVPDSSIQSMLAQLRIIALISFVVGICWVILIRLPLKFFPASPEKQNLVQGLLKRVKQRPYVFLRVVVVAISFITMLTFAGELSLWSDDLATIQFVAEGETLRTVIERVAEEARYNPPLYYVLAYIWLRIAPYGTVYIKLLNILICCVGIWLCGTAARRIQSERAAAIATIFAGTSSFLINYAAYTFRSFALVFLLCPLLIMAYHKRLTEPEHVCNLVVYGVLHALLLYTNYICILITAIMGLYDLWLFVRKRIKLDFIFSYLIAGVAFLPLLLFALSDVVESHLNFWPAVPTLGNLLGTISLIFSDKIFIWLFFTVASAIAFLMPVHKDEGDTASKVFAPKDVVIVLVLWAVFIVGFVYVFSRYIYPTGSIFVERYFISALAPALIAAAIGLDWVVVALINKRERECVKVLVIAAIAACYCATQYDCLIKLNTFPGTTDSPYEQAIDWIYRNKDAHNESSLVVMTGYPGGLYYYGTHGGQRPNLNFGYLDDSNWQSYDVVFASPMHTELPSDTQRILNEHFDEFTRNDALRVIGYKRKME